MIEVTRGSVPYQRSGTSEPENGRSTATREALVRQGRRKPRHQRSRRVERVRPEAHVRAVRVLVRLTRERDGRERVRVEHQAGPERVERRRDEALEGGVVRLVPARPSAGIARPGRPPGADRRRPSACTRPPAPPAPSARGHRPGTAPGPRPGATPGSRTASRPGRGSTRTGGPCGRSVSRSSSAASASSSRRIPPRSPGGMWRDECGTCPTIGRAAAVGPRISNAGLASGDVTGRPARPLPGPGSDQRQCASSSSGTPASASGPLPAS